MTTNQFFSSNYFSTAKDQALLDSLSREQIQIYGIDCYYIPRELVNFDKLFGEDQSSSFTDAYTIELLVKSIDSFGGDGNFLSKFGIEIQDEMTFSVHRGRFATEILANEPAMTRPMEGDLIAVQSPIDFRKRVFEITYVNQEEFYYQQGQLYTWEIRVKTFSFGGETFNTGISDIDDMEDYSVNRVILLTGVTGSYTVGETVTITGTTDSAEVVLWDAGESELVLTKVKGEFSTGTVVGSDSGASGTLNSTTEQTNSEKSDADNDFIEARQVNFVDFTEKNPFSEE